MEPKFWIAAWDEGRTGFHQEHFNPKLLKYFPQFNPQPGDKVLVPLCGKTKDLLWLQELQLHVHGVELYEKAVKSFFQENHLEHFKVVQDQNFVHYHLKNLVLSCGDFFKINKTDEYDFIYDRASLVALPPDMRKEYASVVQRSLKKGGQYLLIVYEYDQTELGGPPFSISDQEIHELYGSDFTIELMESEKPLQEGPRFSALNYFVRKVYTLQRATP